MQLLPLSTITGIATIVISLGGFVAAVKYLGRWIKQRDDELKELKLLVSLHIANIQIHIDPNRDTGRWQELVTNVGKLSDSMTKLSEAFIAHRAAFEAFLVTRTQPPIKGGVD